MTSFIYQNCTVGEVTGMSDSGALALISSTNVGSPFSRSRLGHETMPHRRAPKSPRLLRRRLRSQGPH